MILQLNGTNDVQEVLIPPSGSLESDDKVIYQLRPNKEVLLIFEVNFRSNNAKHSMDAHYLCITYSQLHPIRTIITHATKHNSSAPFTTASQGQITSPLATPLSFAPTSQVCPLLTLSTFTLFCRVNRRLCQEYEKVLQNRTTKC